jgi:beta-aspartyl-dipeptidase (metallo-type)
MLTLIENGDVYAPEPLGRRSVLLVDGKIGKVGDVDRRALDALGVEHRVIDASGHIVAPGLVDPHQHLLGGSGEGGLSLQTPMLFLGELVESGVTTVVGTLGVDTTMKTMAGLLGRVKALKEEGLSAYLWSGGYNVPPVSVMRSVREDMMFIDECVGAGEVAVADERALAPTAQQLAELVHDVHVGGLLSRKAGVTHFHVGSGPQRLRLLRELIERHDVPVEWLYPTHVQRNEKLLDEALALVARGMTVDFDTTQRDLARWFRYYLDHDGDPARLTISSDADSGTPRWHWEQLCGLVVQYGHALERVLPLATSNVARVLKLGRKGRLAPGCDGDLLVLAQGTLDIVHVIAGGVSMVEDGQVVVRERFLEESGRRYTLRGAKA